jgi:hypothetical protein
VILSDAPSSKDGVLLDTMYSLSVVATGAPFDNLHDNPRYQALMQLK